MCQHVAAGGCIDDVDKKDEAAHLPAVACVWLWLVAASGLHLNFDIWCQL
jgi:hypothetical protein